MSKLSRLSHNVYSATKISWFVFMLFSMILLGKGLINYVIDKTLPPTHWMYYESISPRPPTVKLGEPIWWHTRAVRHVKADVEWYDTLMCQYEGTAEIVTMAPPVASKRFAAPPAYIGNPTIQGMSDSEYKQLSGIWKWEGGMPDKPAECFLRAQIKIHPSPFVEKTFTVESEKVQFQ